MVQKLARLQSLGQYLTKPTFLFGLPTLLMVGAISIAGTAGGGTTGAEFQGLYNMMFGWATGYFGRSLAIGAFLLGAITGLMGKVVMCLSGIGFAIVLTLGPGVIDGMFAALI